MSDADVAHTVTGGRYDLNVTRLLADYPDFVICGDAGGWTARTRTGTGSGGARLRATSLDELAEQMDACRRRGDGV